MQNIQQIIFHFLVKAELRITQQNILQIYIPAPSLVKLQNTFIESWFESGNKR